MSAAPVILQFITESQFPPIFAIANSAIREIVGGMKRVAIYSRVSTLDGKQTVENQLRDLHQAADRLSWNIVATFTDEGISGAKGRDKRPGLDALMKGIARKDFDMVASWSVCRLGRSLQHLVHLLGELDARGVDLYLHVQAIDTSTPHRDEPCSRCSAFLPN